MFIETNECNLKYSITSLIVDHLRIYKIPSILIPKNVILIEEEELIDITNDRRLSSMYNNVQLSSFWINASKIYSTICEISFSAMLLIKSYKRGSLNMLDDELRVDDGWRAESVDVFMGLLSKKEFLKESFQSDNLENEIFWKNYLPFDLY
ncbi:hypothetical protein A3Q56_03941 [Intoshia linei]|uniref:Uncharacterized protein n=1 Tax=Intoshia linei TaxID=1819745 RepID=A0A177B3X0_9BILA|nr:hypothetical protein A3Q56_03941 [Intoshia linei]